MFDHFKKHHLLELNGNFNPRKLLEYLGKNTDISSLVIADCCISKSSFKTLLSSKKLCNLTKFGATNINLTGCNLVVVLKDSSFLESISSLDLSSCYLEDEDIKSLVAFPQFYRLLYLNLSNNYITSKGATCIFNSKNLTNLLELTLNHNVLFKYSKKSAMFQSKGLPKLKMLSMNSVAITNRNSKLFNFLKNTHNIEVLNLSNNYLFSEGLMYFLSLNNHSKLKKLDFSSNYIDDEGIEALAKCKSLNLTYLNLCNNNIKSYGFIKLMNSKYMKNLNELYIANNMIGPEGALSYSKSRYVSNLQTLHLSNNPILLEGFSYIWNCYNMRSMVKFYLSRNKINTGINNYLINTQNLSNLKVLDLSENYLDCQSLAILSNSENMKNLTDLLLDGNMIECKGLESLAQSSKILNLVNLSLKDNLFREEAIVSLVTSRNMRNLESLRIKVNCYDSFLQCILELGNLSNLKTLDLFIYENLNYDFSDTTLCHNYSNITHLALSNNEIYGEQLVLLLKNKTLNNIEFLDLSKNKIANEGAIAIAEYQFSNIKTLNLAQNKITDEGFVPICNSKYMISLVELDLSHNDISTRGFNSLAKSKYLTNLKSLNLYYASIRPRGCIGLASSFNFFKLKFLDISSNRFCDEIIALSKSKSIRNLTNLNVSFNCINKEKTGDAIVAILKSDNFRNLKLLDLSNSNLKLTDIQTGSCQKLGNLQVLYLQSMKMPFNECIDFLNFICLDNITDICLRSNNIDYQSFITLYKENMLNLKNIYIGDKDLPSSFIAKMITHSTKLKILKLDTTNTSLNLSTITAISNGLYLPNLSTLYIQFIKPKIYLVKAFVSNFSLKKLKALDIKINQDIFIESCEMIYERIPNEIYLDVWPINGNYDPLIRFLKIIRNNEKNQYLNLLDETRKAIFNAISNDNFDLDEDSPAIPYMINNIKRFPFLINAVNNRGLSLMMMSSTAPKTQLFLFKNGAIPCRKGNELDDNLVELCDDSQSVHNFKIVQKTHFAVKRLIDVYNIDFKSKLLIEKALECKTNISSLFEHENNKQSYVIKLLDMASLDKHSLLKLIEIHEVIDDMSFVGLIKKSVIKYLEKLLPTDYPKSSKDYYSDAKMQYSWEKDDEKYITILESIGLIQVMIEKLKIPRSHKQEICATFIYQNLKNPCILQKAINYLNTLSVNLNVELQEKSEIHCILDYLTEQNIEQIFLLSSMTDIEMAWREQQYFKLAKQLFIAANTYGEGQTACLQGTWIQIITTAYEIDETLIDKYSEYLAELAEIERLMSVINERNITSFAKNIIDLIYDKDIINDIQLREEFIGFLIGCVDISKPQDININQQIILSKINKMFEIIKQYLPNYNLEVPSFSEYKTVIESIPKLSNSDKVLEFIKNTHLPFRPKRTKIKK